MAGLFTAAESQQGKGCCHLHSAGLGVLRLLGQVGAQFGRALRLRQCLLVAALAGEDTGQADPETQGEQFCLWGYVESRAGENFGFLVAALPVEGVDQSAPGRRPDGGHHLRPFAEGRHPDDGRAPRCSDDGSALRFALGVSSERGEGLHAVHTQYQSLRVLGAEDAAEDEQQFIVGSESLRVAALGAHCLRGRAGAVRLTSGCDVGSCRGHRANGRCQSPLSASCPSAAAHDRAPSGEGRTVGFFEDLIVEPEPEPERPEFVDLGPLGDRVREMPPVEYVVPSVVEHIAEVGSGDYARLILKRFSVWPDSVTLHLAVYLRRFRTSEHLHFGRPAPGGLRAGVVLADGRRVTTLDGQPWPAGGASGRRITLQPLGGGGGGGGGFYREVDLWLSELPPAGELTLVVEWPDEDVPERSTRIDVSEILSAAGRTTEVWPGLQPPSPRPAGAPSLVAALSLGGSAAIMATTATGHAPQHRTGNEKPEDPARYEPQADWAGLRHWSGDWTDLRLVRTRLDAGAEPQKALHVATTHGSPEVLAELIRRVKDVDVRDSENFTPLWEAVCWGKPENVSLLLEGGADPWLPQCSGHSAGGLALTSPSLAPLFENLPGAVLPGPAERALQDEADQLIAVFEGVQTDGLGVAFVAGLDEEETIRRLGADPADHPVLDLDREPGRYGTGPGGFDPHDYDEADQYVGVTGVPGGCVLVQPVGYWPSRAERLLPLSRSTVACGIFFNPKGGTFGATVRNGETEWNDELSLSPGSDTDPEWWLLRLWDWSLSHGAREIAYACWKAGMRLTDSSPVSGPPSRWVKVSLEE